MSSRSSLIAASVAALSLLASAATASAACKTMGFTVNDYGKDGPTKDAKELLDKDIAKWAADNGVEKYTVGKKTVKCELFLDVILFDEHTCTASASVCWGEGSTPPAKTAKDGAPQKKSEAKAAAQSEAKPPVETGAIPPDAAPAKSEAPAAAETPVQKPVEAAATPPPAATPPAASESDAAERAAAAAERAAAAAERAAAAAEKAAAGHKSVAADDAPPIDATRQIAPANSTAPKP